MPFRGNPDEAYAMWSKIDATGWRFLIVAGGLADQPEALFDDVLTVEFMYRRMKERAKEEADAHG